MLKELLLNELKVLEQTDHPHITRVFELLEDKTLYYVVMEYLPGGDLLGRLTKLRRFSEREAAGIIF